MVYSSNSPLLGRKKRNVELFNPGDDFLTLFNSQKYMVKDELLHLEIRKNNYLQSRWISFFSVPHGARF